MSIAEKSTAAEVVGTQIPTASVRRRTLPFNVDLLISVGFVFVLLALWQWTITIGVLDSRLWPTPTTIATEMWRHAP